MRSPLIARLAEAITRPGLRAEAISLLAIVSILLGSCSGNNDYRPESHLQVVEQDQLMNGVIRYISRSPDGVSPDDRFDPEHDEHYEEQKSAHRLDALFEDDNTYYFLVSRIAPSLTEKRVAIGGKVTMDENMHVQYYEEIFRTWKMEPDTLAKRGLFLFDRMVRGEDLTRYYANKSGNTDYIEFPDDRTYFDTQQRIWRSRPR